MGYVFTGESRSAVLQKVPESNRPCQVIGSHGVEAIDLLKVDVEGAEESVLLGMGGGDWARVQAAVIEVHDLGGRLGRIQALCEKHGLLHQVRRLVPLGPASPARPLGPTSPHRCPGTQEVSHEPLFAGVNFKFRGQAEGSLHAETNFHMATLTAARYPLDAKAKATAKARSPSPGAKPQRG